MRPNTNIKIRLFHTLGVLVIAILAASGCAKKVVAVKPAVAPPVAELAKNAPASVSPQTTSVAPPRPVDTPKSRVPDGPTRARIDQLLAKIEDAYFDYDRASLRPDAINALAADSSELRDILKDYPDYKLKVEGHCDERGSAEYNLALGEQRAEAAKNYLVNVGIPSGQLSTVSYGKERPACSEATEGCWQKNRRIHIVAAANE